LTSSPTLDNAAVDEFPYESSDVAGEFLRIGLDLFGQAVDDDSVAGFRG
jgi:hypothetical protein